MPTATPFNNLITFSRGSNATVTGSNGLIQWAPNNLLTFSEQFDNAAWAKSNVTVIANQDVGNGTLGAELQPNGDFAGGFTSWTPGSAWSIVSGRAFINYSGTGSILAGAFTPVVGSLYLLTFDYEHVSGSNIARIGGTEYNIPAATGTYRVYLRAGSTATLQFSTNSGTAQYYVDNVSVREITPAAATAPDGTRTADTLITAAATGAVSSYSTSQNAIWNTADTRTVSFYVKSSGLRYATIGVHNGAGFTTATSFDLQTGSVAASDTHPTYTTLGVASVQNVGGGWYRCAVPITGLDTSAKQPYIVGSSTFGGLYNRDVTGNGTSGILIWGAQLELGSAATTYNSTTVKNLLGFSEAFDNAFWTKANASIVTGAQANPINGLFNAQKLMEDTVAAVPHGFASANVTTIVGTPMTSAFYAKAAGRSWVVANAFNAANKRCWFDLANGTAGTTAAGCTTSITSVGNGWYRCAVIQTAAATTMSLGLYAATADGVLSYTGDGNSGVYIYGAQLSDSASLDPYVPTPGAAPSSTAFYGPRFDFDPVTRQPRGILIEEQRTNIVTYSDQFDNSAWTKTRCQIVANVDPAAATFGPELGDAALLNIRPATGGTVTRSGGIITFAAPASGLSTSISQEITVTPGRLYRLRGRMRFVSGTLGGQAIQIRTASGGGGSETGSVFYTGGSSFQTLDLYFVPTVSPVFATFLAINGSTIEVEEASYSVRELIGGGLIAPDGTSTADTLVEDYTTSTHPVSAAVTLTAAAHTMAFYVKASGRSWTQLNLLGTANAFANFNVSTGTLGTVGAAATATITPVGNGWYRCTMTATTGAGANTVAIYPASADNTVSYTGTGIPSLFLWGAQLEAGAFATSYIPTVASTVTRSADIATISGQNFAQWYRQDEGAFVVNFDVLSTAINADIMIASTSGSFNPGSSGIYGTSTPVTYVRSNSAYISTLATIGSISSNVPAKIAYAYSASSAANSLNAGAISSNTPTGPMPTTVNQLAWFTTGVTGLTHSGHIRSINFVPARAADFQLQALTAQSIVDYFYLQTAAGDQLIAGNDDYLYSLPILG